MKFSLRPARRATKKSGPTAVSSACAACGEGPISDGNEQYNALRWYVVERDGHLFTFTDGSASGPVLEDFDGIGRLVSISNERGDAVIRLCWYCERAKEFGGQEELRRRSWRPWMQRATV